MAMSTGKREIIQLLSDDENSCSLHSSSSIEEKKQRKKDTFSTTGVCTQKFPPYDVDDSNKMAVVQPSEKWRTCMEMLEKTGESYFIDPDFPPITQSLDGRKRTRSTLSAETSSAPSSSATNSTENPYKPVLCVCGLPASAKQVQSDGPNYGKFYLACGNTQRKKQTISDSSLNPYKKQQQSKKCNFFRWDPNGSLGAASAAATSSGYSARFERLSWYHFGTKPLQEEKRGRQLEAPPLLAQTSCSLFRDSIGPDQVQQGAVGNCWFLSALAVIAEKQFLVHRIIPHSELNQKGCYEINLCLDGQWRGIIIDSNLPVVMSTECYKERAGLPVPGVSTPGNPVMAYAAFCATPKLQLWPALVEKAYAKAHGSYAQLSGGFIAEGLADLTGAPTETIIFSEMLDSNVFWARLLSFHEAGFLMGVATSRGGEGLVGSHAYSVLDVIDIPDSCVGEQAKVTDFFSADAKAPKTEEVQFVAQKSYPGTCRQRVRLVRIRNPWGKREWKGDWSAESERWTNNLRRQLGKTSYAKGDGTFFMSLEDMLSRFHHMDVAKVHENWIHLSLEGTWLGRKDPLQTSQLMYLMKSMRNTYATISIIQPKKRANTDSSQWYYDPNLIILRREQNSTDWQRSHFELTGIRRSSDISLFLDSKFEYCCIPFSCTAHCSEARGKEQSFRLVVYSATAVATTSTSNKEVAQSVLRHFHTELLSREHKLLYRLSSDGFLVAIHGTGCLYFMLVNCSCDTLLSVRLSIDVPKGVRLCFGQNSSTHDSGPHQQRILAVVCCDGKTSSAATQLTFRFLSSTMAVKKTGKSQNQDHTGIHNRTPGALCSLGDTLGATMASEMYHQSLLGSPIQHRGEDTVDTYLWIPQLGSFPADG